ncbi:hypothetical protein D3C72_1556530 [compost metagenome]
MPIDSLPVLNSATVGQGEVTPQPSLGANLSLSNLAMPLQMMGSERASSLGMVGMGLSLLMMTVCSSGVCTSVKFCIGSMYERDTLVSLFSTRQMVNSTSFDVNGSPLENFTPLRSLSSQVLSSTGFHDSARPGISSIFALRLISDSKIWAENESFVVTLW